MSPRNAPIGNVIGHYRVEACISAGGFGVVYRVTRDGKPYALKLPLMDDPFEYHADRKVLEQRITREVIALMTLKHPNIVRVHGFDRWPNAETGALYLVMDFIEGLPLLQWIEQAKPTLRVVVEAFLTLGLALAEMHRLGVVHRDLKSSNVLVAAEADKRFNALWKPVIVDFGLARPAFTHDVTREHALLGTEGLWAPEQLKAALQLPDDDGRPASPGRSQYSAASDLHALGLLFYEAVTGRRAFLKGGGDFAALLTTVPRAPSTLNRALPDCLDGPVMRLLARNPADRHANGADLADELGRLLEQKDPRWDAVLSPTEATTDDRLGAVTAQQRPHPFEETRQDFALSLLDSSTVRDFMPRQSDAPRTASITARVPHIPALRVAVPPTQRGGLSDRFGRGGRLIASVALSLGLGVGVAFGAHGVWTQSRHRTAEPVAITAAPASVLASISDLAPKEVAASQPQAMPPPAPPLRAPSAPAAIRAVASATSLRRAVSTRAVLLGRVQEGLTEVTLIEPVIAGGRLVMPTGTRLTGVARELVGGRGFQLTFSHARKPDGGALPARGSAFAEPSAGRRLPLRAGAPPARMELVVTLDAQ